MYTYLAIDVLNIAHRLFSTLEDKSLCKVSNKVIYKDFIKEFIELVAYWKNRYLTPEGKIYLLFDNATSRDEIKNLFSPLSPSMSRKEKFPEYKSNRKAQSKEFYNSVDLLKWFYMMYDDCYFTVRINHVEADDLVKPLLESIEKDSKVLLVTNDSDWCRFIDNNVNYLPQLYERPFTFEDFNQINGYLPTEDKIVFNKIIYGDSADHVQSAFPDLTKAQKDEIFKSSDSVTEFYKNLRTLNLSKDIINYCLDREREAQSAFQMVSLIPISEGHFKASIVQGRKASVYTDALLKLVGLGSEDSSFKFGFLAYPRLDPRE